METVKDWISQEAEYQAQAAEIKHGFPRVRQDKFNGHDTNGDGHTMVIGLMMAISGIRNAQFVERFIQSGDVQPLK